MGGFHDLQGSGLIFFQNPEGPAARLSFVFDHAAHAQRPVQPSKQPLSFLPGRQLREFFGKVRAQHIAAEIRDSLKVRQGKTLLFQPPQAGINLPPRLDHQSPQYFFAGQNLLLQRLRRNIIDIFYKNEIGVDPLKVLQKSAVSAGPENQAALFITERSGLPIRSHDARGRGLQG